MVVECFDQLGEVDEGTGETFDLVDKDNVDLVTRPCSKSCKAGRSNEPPDRPPPSSNRSRTTTPPSCARLLI